MLQFPNWSNLENFYNYPVTNKSALAQHIAALDPL